MKGKIMKTNASTVPSMIVWNTTPSGSTISNVETQSFLSVKNWAVVPSSSINVLHCV